MSAVLQLHDTRRYDDENAQARRSTLQGIGTRGDDVVTRASIADHDHGGRTGGEPVSRTPARRRRCWLILANLAGWALIILAAYELFS
jgi:hypothetical protein